MAEGYATLTSFAADVTSRGQASDRNHFHLGQSQLISTSLFYDLFS